MCRCAERRAAITWMASGIVTADAALVQAGVSQFAAASAADVRAVASAFSAQWAKVRRARNG